MASTLMTSPREPEPDSRHPREPCEQLGTMNHRPRQMVMRLAPEEDETLPSFIARLADQHQTELIEMLHWTGLVARTAKRPLGYGIDVEPSEAETLSHVTGVPEERVRRMVIGHLHGRAVD